MNFEYRSCQFIEGGFTLWPNNKATPCCLSIYDSFMNSSQLTVHPESFPLGAWQKWREKTREKLRGGYVPSECRRCPLLQKGTWGKMPNEPFFSTINIINSTICNIRCNFCYLTKEFKAPDYRFDSHLGMFRDMAAKGLIGSGSVIFWGGGEPALHPNLREMYALFREAGCRQHFDTNATIYMDFLQEDLAAGLTMLSCSLMTPDPGTYHAVMGRDLGPQTWANAAKYAASGGDIRAKFLMLPENEGQEESFVLACKERGIQIANVDLEIYQGVSAASLMAHRLAKFCHYAAVYGLDVLHGNGVAYAGQNFLETYREAQQKNRDRILREYKERCRRWSLSLSVVGQASEALANQAFLLGLGSDLVPLVDMRCLSVKRNMGWSAKPYAFFSEHFFYFTEQRYMSLDFEAIFAERLVLRFFAHPWSGIIKIDINGKNSMMVNLYSPNNRLVEVDLMTQVCTYRERSF